MIQDQVKLPIRVAFGVVMQGIRIRFGRSVVTIMGVVFGVAFLTSILTGQVIKTGVAEEDELRTEVKQMYSFLTAEMGSPKDRAIGVVHLGALSEKENRLLRILIKQGLKRLLWTSTGDVPVGEAAEGVNLTGGNGEFKEVPLEEVSRDVSALLVLGEGALPAISWDELLEKARQKLITFSRKDVSIKTSETVTAVSLDRELRKEEKDKLAQEERKRKSRNLWIIIIALLVTVMGISNAMLMSVTERFREIGTMKCLGALSGFIRIIFLIESCIMGVTGGLIGGISGALFSGVIYGFTYGFGLTLGSLNIGALFLYVLLALIGGIVLSVLAAIYPASVASRMIPADALRTNI